MKTPFAGPYARELQEFLTYKRALGMGYGRSGETLKSFDRYTRGQRGGRSRSLERMISGWLARGDGRKSYTVACYQGVIRQFCLFRRRHDPGSFVPESHPAAKRAEACFIPHVFSLAEIGRMITEAGHPRFPAAARARIRLIVLVLYCTGMRFGELARLKVSDFDPCRRLLWIRKSKGRTRLVTLGADLVAELSRHLAIRGGPGARADAPLLLSPTGRALNVRSISHTLRQLLRRSRLKTPWGRSGPRPYDLRHTFAVHRLERWYRRGVDVTRRLPWLSVYMGHLNILGTESYLHATPRLLSLAARRLARQLGRVRG